MRNPLDGPKTTLSILKYHFANTTERNRYINNCAHNFRKDNTHPTMIADDIKIRDRLVEQSKYCSQFQGEENKAFFVIKDDITYGPEDRDGNPLYNADGSRYEDYDFVRTVDERIEKKKIKPRGDSVNAVQVTLKITKGWSALPENFDFDKWIDDSVKWLKDTWGEENLVSVVLHTDETIPHIHAMVTPITKDDRLSCRDWLRFGSDVAKMHQSYFKYVKQEGIQIGDSKQKLPYPGDGSQRRLENALSRAGVIDFDMPEIEKGENVQEYRERVRGEVEQYAKHKQVEITDFYQEAATENANLTKELEDLKAEIEKEKEKSRQFREKYEREKAETEFLIKQQTGSGVSRSALKNSAELETQLTQKHEEDMNRMAVRLGREQRKNQELNSENDRLRAIISEQGHQIDLINDLIAKNGFSEQAIKYLKRMNETMDALRDIANGSIAESEFSKADAEAFKKEWVRLIKAGSGKKKEINPPSR